MVLSNAYPVSPAWRLLMQDLGVSAPNVLRRAGVAEDLFAREHPTLRPEEFCRMMWAVDAEANDPCLAIRIGEALSFEMFDPPVFAAMCSPDLNTALRRLARYKSLCAPISLTVAVTDEATRIEVEWIAAPHVPPPLIYAIELTYCVGLARLGSRMPVRPRLVRSPHALEPVAAYAAYFGVEVTHGEATVLEFDAADAVLPFLTAQAGMWAVFEPELRRRLGELETNASTAERVRAALLELLPSGRASVLEVSQKLGVSQRTLQRRLQDEGKNFQRVLDATREELARYYLTHTGMPGAEISFLLGFEDPNSFVRAFHGWTGSTPEQLRTRVRTPDARGAPR